MSFKNEKTINTKKCLSCGDTFHITDKDLEFYDKVSPTFDGKKYSIPTPKFCPDCRIQRRQSFRNERSIYKRKCDAIGKDIISMYSPNKSCLVYDQDFWWSDKWDAMDFGVDYNFEESFFEQFAQLLKKVPRLSLSNSNKFNSDFCNHTTSMKDCYFVFGSAESEKCLYANRIEKSDHVVDSSFINNSSFVYECFDVKDSYNIYFSQKCYSCSDSFYLFDCHNCKNCFGSTNLINKQYYIFNEKYSKDEYFAKLDELKLNYDTSEFKNRIKLNARIKHITIENSENVVGDAIYNSKNITYGFGIYDSENIKYSQDLYNNSSHSYDCYSGYGPIEKCYECHSFGVEGYHNLFISDCYPAREVFYSDNCYGCSNIFGCAGLKNKQYCIFNKQYSKEEYEKMVPKIIRKMMENGEWGEFFPSSLSPFGYNESVVNEYFPLEKQEAKKQGFNWSDYEAPFPKAAKIIPAHKLPKNIKDISDDILNWAITCEVTGRPFRIIPQELEFYRKHNLPIPRRHPDQRHIDRMNKKNPHYLYDRKCHRCDTDIQTTYHPDRAEKILCEECYNKEIY